MNQAAFLALLMLQPPAATYTISGSVVNALSGAPLARARVTLIETTGRRPVGECMTDGSGEFRFAGLAAGKYALEAEKPGYVMQAFGQKALYAPFSSAIVAGEGAASERLRFALIPSAAIVGTVKDEKGEPVAGAVVTAFLRIGAGEVPRWVRFGSAVTNDLGEYRIHSLRRGTYIVMTQGTDWQAQEGGGDYRRQWGYPPTFSPGVTDSLKAAWIALEPGTEGRADISVRGTRLVSVTGTLADKHSLPNCHAALLAPFARLSYLQVGATAEVTQAGFVIRNVPPGAYALVVRLATEPRLIAMKQITVGDEPISVELGNEPLPGANLTVEWVDKPPGRSVIVVLDQGGGLGSQAAKLGKDSTVRFALLPPGQYVPKLISGNSQLAVTGMTVDPGRVVHGAIEIQGTGDAEIRLVAVADVQEVRGRVFKDGNPWMGVVVMLLPRNQPVRAAAIAADQSDSDGSFTWHGVAPGEYLAFAFEKGEASDYSDPEVLQPLLRLGQPVTIKAGTNPEVRLEVTRID